MKLYIGIVHSFSTSAKEKVQLQNTWHNCKTICTTAKKNAQWQFSCALFARDCFVEFLSSTLQSNQNILSVPEQVFIRAVSHMKIANVYVGTIDQNVRIALQFSYQFAILIEGKGKYCTTAKTIHN